MCVITVDPKTVPVCPGLVGAQQLEGYGQECFLTKDDSGNEVLLGASLTGIAANHSPDYRTYWPMRASLTGIAANHSTDYRTDWPMRGLTRRYSYQSNEK